MDNAFKIGDFVQYFVYPYEEDEPEIFYGKIREIKTEVRHDRGLDSTALIHVNAMFTEDGEDTSKQRRIDVVLPEEIRDGKKVIEEKIKELNKKLTKLYKIKERIN